MDPKPSTATRRMHSVSVSATKAPAITSSFVYIPPEVSLSWKWHTVLCSSVTHTFFSPEGDESSEGLFCGWWEGFPCSWIGEWTVCSWKYVMHLYGVLCKVCMFPIQSRHVNVYFQSVAVSSNVLPTLVCLQVLVQVMHTMHNSHGIAVFFYRNSENISKERKSIQNYQG